MYINKIRCANADETRCEISELFRVKFIRTHYWAISSLKVPSQLLAQSAIHLRGPLLRILHARANAPEKNAFRERGDSWGRGGAAAVVNCTPDKTRKQLFNLIRSTCATRSIFTFILPARCMQHAPLEHAPFVDTSITKLVSTRLSTCAA